MSAPHPEARIWSLRTSQLFRELTESFYESAQARIVEAPFVKGDEFAFKDAGGECFYIIAEGRVKLSASAPDGRSVNLDILGEQDLFGPVEAAIPSAGPPIAQLAARAVAIEKGVALRLPLAYLRDTLSARPEVLLNLTSLLGEKHQRLQVRISRMMFRSSLGKVTGLLLELAERYGEQDARGLLLSLPLTHKDLASFLGLRRSTVTECLAELELRGLLTSRRGQYRLLDLAQLGEVV